MEILQAAGIHQVEPGSYLRETYSHSVFTRLDPWHYTRLKGDGEFDFRHFVAHPGSYDNNLLPYASKTDIFIACHFWDPHSPKMLDRKTLSMGSIPIRIIADISCDIDGPIASTIRASTIAEPFYGYDPATGQETDPFMESAITVMAVDNLPGELPRDSSADFGEALMEHVIPELLGNKSTGMIRRASIASGGKLTEPYGYLKDFLEGKE
jgi:alanine dehydrogenase